MNPVSRLAAMAAISGTLLLAGCLPALRGTPREQVAVLRGRDAEAILHSGERVLLRAPRVEGDSVFGGWTSGPDGDVRVAVALADIQQLRHVSMGPEPNSARGFFQKVLFLTLLGLAVITASLVSGG